MLGANKIRCSKALGRVCPGASFFGLEILLKYGNGILKLCVKMGMESRIFA